MSITSRGSAVVATTVVFTILAAICVSARFVSRIVILKNVGYEELAILVSMVCAILMTALLCVQVHYGLGKHFWTVSAADFETISLYLWISIHFYNISLTITKLSIVFQYLRVFIDHRTRIVCFSAITFIIVYGLWTLLSGIFNCIPISAFWDSSVQGHCISREFLWFFNSGINILTDVVIITIPLPVISTLKLPRRQKIGLVVIFSLGGFVCLVSIIRLYSLYVIAHATDITWYNPLAAIWSNIEINVGIVCASLPTLKPILSKLFPRLLASSGPHSNTNGTSYQARASRTPAAIRLTDLKEMPTTMTIAEASSHNIREGKLQDTEGIKGIFVSTSMVQDIEGKSEMGSENDLITED